MASPCYACWQGRACVNRGQKIGYSSPSCSRCGRQWWVKLTNHQKMSKDKKHPTVCLADLQPLSPKEMLALKGGNGNAGTPPPPPPPITGSEDVVIH